MFGGEAFSYLLQVLVCTYMERTSSSVRHEPETQLNSGVSSQGFLKSLPKPLRSRGDSRSRGKGSPTNSSIIRHTALQGIVGSAAPAMIHSCRNQLDK